MKEFILKGAQGGSDFHIDYEKELNDEQLAVVKNGGGPTLVLAGAGSGKTRTITYRVAWLLENGVSPSNILLLTFTNKAAKEMISRVEELLGRYPEGLWSGTFHSVSNRLLRRYANLVGFEPNFSILDQEDAKELIGLIVKDLKLNPSGVRFPSSAVLLSIISYQRNKACSMEDALEQKHPKFLPFLRDIEQIADVYRIQKGAQNAMDFDDLLTKLLELLRKNPEVKEVLSSQFEYVLVDEFQDTNLIQAEIVNLLSSKHQNLLVVGDDAQSIYSFRAAEIRNILDFPKQYKSAQTFRLTKNYRSTPEILSLANETISQNIDQFPKELSAIISPGEKPNLVPTQDARQEAQYIAEQILELHETSDLRNIAVLFRAAYHSQSLEFELMKRDIPYEYRGGLKFFERAHVKDVIAHLRMIHNVKDAMAWIRALKIHPGIGLVTANKIARQAGALDTFEQAIAIQVRGKRAQEGWKRFLSIHKALTSSKGSVSDYIRSFAASDEYQWYLENEYPNYHERLEDLEQFALFAEQFDDMTVFLEAVSLTDEYGAVRREGADEDEDRIVLSTIHQAKGLEWDSVFVMHLAEGLFPIERVKNEEGIEEERRLFYVAATRARRNLFLTYPITAGFDSVELKQPSVFVEELSSNLLEQVKLRRSVSAPSGYKGGVGGRSDFHDDPVIVLDDLGERVNRPAPPTSFLRDIDDL